MNRHLLNAALAVGSMILFASSAHAQFYPGGGYGWGNDSGAAALMGSSYVRASTIQAKSQSMQAGQQAAMAQNAVVQSGIRNTLSSQADSRTNAILSQRQSDQDWWFQVQAQQSAARNNTSYASASAPMMVGSPGGGGFGPAGGPPPVAMDIIKWPIVLQDSCFASERAQIEEPYRRTPPKLSIPTADDFRKMVTIIDDMQAVLEWKLREGLRTSDYNTASVFLKEIKREAAARSSATSSN